MIQVDQHTTYERQVVIQEPFRPLPMERGYTPSSKKVRFRMSLQRDGVFLKPVGFQSDVVVSEQKHIAGELSNRLVAPI